MNCKYCGHKLGDDAAYCPSCGREVRLVADYQVLGDSLTSEKPVEKDSRKKKITVSQDEIARAIRHEREEKKRKKKQKQRIAIIVTVVIVIAAAGIGWRMHRTYIEEHSLEYQLSAAESAFSNGKYDAAYDAVQKAIDLDDTSADAWLLKADILYAQKEYDKAESVLKKLISLYPENTTAYSTLIRIYETNQQQDKIADLFASCTDLTIRDKFSAYICNAPAADPESGSYSDYVNVTLTADEDTKIYYTTDGTLPSRENGSLYSEPIALEEGSTTLKAVAINAKNITSDLVTLSYSVLYPVPDTPKIAPSSGKFTDGMDTTIQVIVPDGCTAYYAFDKKPTEKTGKKYTGPVEMPDGEHTFYAILINAYGKSSYAASAVYINESSAAESSTEEPETEE